MPAVGIAGAPNAGKSTLLNKLLGRQRSIVSDKRKTTRDVLTGELTISGCRCILFDCAGLLTHAETILDELAQQAAIEALRNALVVIFCVDIAKPDWAEDLAVWDLLCHCEESKFTRLRRAISFIPLATKIDLLSEKDTAEKISQLKSLFGCNFLPVSAKTSVGLDKLKTEIVARLIESHNAGRNTHDALALTAGHRQALTSAIENITQAVSELKAGNTEIASMLLRTAHNLLSDIDRHNLDEQLLDRIFSRFCIGK